jgi:hypothetical protein
VIRRTTANSGGFIFACNDCVHVEIDGGSKWNGAPSGQTYGIKITTEASGDSPSTFLMMTGLSSNFVIRNIEIDGKWPALSRNGIGIQVNDHSVLASANPGKWRQGIIIENNFVHDVEGEGLYVGPNVPQDGLPLRNVEIRDNIVKRTGWDCIQAKNMRDGRNAIHHNTVTDCGIAADGTAGQHFGISCYESTGCFIYSNWVQTVGEAGINCLIQNLSAAEGTQTCNIYNNVVLDTGVSGPTPGDGIAITIRDGAASIRARVYNNTVVGADGHCINGDNQTESGTIQNNITVGCGGSSVSAPDSVSVTNNLSGTVQSVGFVDIARNNYRLLASSPAIDSVTSGYPDEDFDRVQRPQAGSADKGAYEYLRDQGATRPNPPSALTVE